MKEIKDILRPLKKKLNLEKWLKNLIWSETAAFAAVFAMLIFSKFIYIRNMYSIFIVLIFVSFIISLIITFWKQTSFKDTAKVYDSLGMEERFITALEIAEENRNGNIDLMVVKDAIEKGKDAKLEKYYKIALPQKVLKIFILLLILIFASGFIKNPNVIDTKGILKTELKELEEIKKDINKEKNIEKQDLKEINKEINSIVKEIKHATSKSEAIKEMDTGQQRLKKLEKSGKAKDLNQISQSLSENKTTEQLGEAIKSSNLAAVSQELDKLNEKLSELTEDELKNLLDQLSESVESISDEELKEAVEKYVQNVSNGESNGDTNGLKTVKDSLNRSISSAKNVKDAVKDANEILAKASQKVQNPEEQQTSAAEGSGEGQGNGSTPGEGQSGSNGTGSGQGQGNVPGGNGRGQGHVEAEKVYTRDLENKSGYDTQIQGAETGDGSTETEQGRTVGAAGESVPYDEVFLEYKEGALKSLEESSIPFGMKELVADYFSQLEK